MLKLITDKSVHEDNNPEDLQNILNTSELNQSNISKYSCTKSEKRKPVYVKKKIATNKEL